MLKQSILTFMCSVLLFNIVNVFGQIPILDKNGNATGLINMNPDPDGEPWISGGLKPLTEEEKEAFNRLPNFELPDRLKGRELPPTHDNSTTPQFRPIFNQIGGSCGQASGQGYHFTYERNLALGTLPTTNDNICAYGFAWNFVNEGSGKGSWPSSGYTIAEQMGSAHVTDFNNSDNGGGKSVWMDGYKGYYNANDCHIIEQVKFDFKDVEKLKNWFFDKGTGSKKHGGCVTFGASTDFDVKTIESGPFAGQKLSVTLVNGTSHAMTLTGYSDEIGYDLNGDGRITNDIDITRDGKVDIKDWEKGAWQLVNSWGDTWQNGGKIWVLYSGFEAQQIIGIKVKPFETKMMLKVTVDHGQRSLLVLRSGFSPDINATKPSKSKNYYAFTNKGGPMPMSGLNSSSTLEIGLDVTEFYTPGMVEGKVFLEAISSSGTIKNMSLFDYTSGDVVETICDQSNVRISDTTHLSVAKGFIAFVLKSPNGGEILNQGQKHKIDFKCNFEEDIKIELLKDSVVEMVIAEKASSKDPYDWTIDENIKDGVNYKIKITRLDINSIFDISDSTFIINSKPTFTSEPIKEAIKDVEYTYNITTKDKGDLSDLSLSIVGDLPKWLTFKDKGNGKALLSGTPKEIDDYKIVIAVKDAINPEPTLQEFTIKITENSVPEFTSEPVEVGMVGVEYNYEITASDENENQKLVFSSVDLPKWLTLEDKEDGTALLSGTPEKEDEGNNWITLTLSDGIIEKPVDQDFIIKVEPENAIITVFNKEKFTKNFYFVAEPALADANCKKIQFDFKTPAEIIWGEINVYDALSNNVFNSSFESAYSGPISWKLGNSIERTIANGMYLAILKIKYIDGSIQYLKTPIGIKAK